MEKEQRTQDIPNTVTHFSDVLFFVIQSHEIVRIMISLLPSVYIVEN